jgi:glycosyltransferase involved in cell wall biosynthesis
MAIYGKKVVVVMPAYNSEQTIEKTYREIDRSVVDEVVLVDDASVDRTIEVARSLPIHVLRHKQNLGYGGNQKTCYSYALSLGADIVIMLHADYQYSPKLVVAMASMIASGLYDCVLASRILGKEQLSGGMPLYKYVANRTLTFIQNLLCNHKLSEYHTGYRAFSREILQKLPLNNNDNDFIFDNQMLAQIIVAGYRIGEVSCPTVYLPDSSSISFWRSVKYGFGVLGISVLTFFAHNNIKLSKIFDFGDAQLQDIAARNVEVVQVPRMAATCADGV